MNIDEFRALKAQSEQEEVTPSAPTSAPANEPVLETQETATTVEGATPNQTNETQTVDTPSTPETIEIDGKEVTIDELKNGYLRQSDYTKKTQEIRRKEQEAEQALQVIQQLQQNPQVAQQLSQELSLPILDPVQSQFTDLENKYFDLLIQSELRELHDKYGEFDETELLELARDEGINSLDTAYHVFTSRKGGGRSTEALDVNDIKEQLRQELLAELKAEQDARVDTTTVIQTGGGSAPLRNNEPQLSPAESKVARMMGMGLKEYAKWRDAKKKR